MFQHRRLVTEHMCFVSFEDMSVGFVYRSGPRVGPRSIGPSQVGPYGPAGATDGKEAHVKDSAVVDARLIAESEGVR